MWLTSPSTMRKCLVNAHALWYYVHFLQQSLAHLLQIRWNARVGGVFFNAGSQLSMSVINGSTATASGQGLHLVPANQIAVFHVHTNSAAAADLAVNITGRSNWCHIHHGIIHRGIANCLLFFSSPHWPEFFITPASPDSVSHLMAVVPPPPKGTQVGFHYAPIYGIILQPIGTECTTHYDRLNPSYSNLGLPKTPSHFHQAKVQWKRNFIAYKAC